MPAPVAPADLPAAQEPSEVDDVCMKFKAGPNVALSGARQRVRLNKMLGDARELAAKTHRLRVRASAHANSSIPHRLALAKEGRAASGPNASISQAASMAGCLGAE